MKYYAVKVGKVPGIYYTWNECKEQVNGYKGACYKSFDSLSKAEAFINPPQSSDNNTKDYTIIYTDGAYAGVKAGIGVWFGDNDKRNVSELMPLENHTNQRAELYAILRALQIESGNIHIYTDSVYSINCMSAWIHDWVQNGWKTSTGSVKNKDIIEQIYALSQGRNIKFSHVDGHSGIYGNEEADRLAKKAIA